MSKKKENYTKFLTNQPNDLLEEVSKYRHEAEFDNRNEAIEALLRKGLEKVKEEKGK